LIGSWNFLKENSVDRQLKPHTHTTEVFLVLLRRARSPQEGSLQLHSCKRGISPAPSATLTPRPRRHRPQWRHIRPICFLEFPLAPAFARFRSSSSPLLPLLLLLRLLAEAGGSGGGGGGGGGGGAARDTAGQGRAGRALLEPQAARGGPSPAVTRPRKTAAGPRGELGKIRGGCTRSPRQLRGCLFPFASLAPLPPSPSSSHSLAVAPTPPGPHVTLASPDTWREKGAQGGPAVPPYLPPEA
jgi:hypothetical protein